MCTDFLRFARGVHVVRSGDSRGSRDMTTSDTYPNPLTPNNRSGGSRQRITWLPVSFRKS